jgi:hypothetical protein
MLENKIAQNNGTRKGKERRENQMQVRLEKK